MIKRIAAVLAVLFLIFSAGCITTDASLEKAAKETVDEIAEELNEMSEEMREAGDAILASGGDAKAAEDALFELYEDTDYSISILYADADEICIAVYPDIIKDSVGKDLSVYGTDEAYYAGRDIALTNYQLLESGFYSSVLSMPLYDDGKFAGYISDALDLTKMMDKVEVELRSDFGYSLWVVEPSGMQIYDSDAEEVGLNILTDTLYAKADVRAAAEKICAEKSGTASYSLVENGRVSVKEAAWETLSYGGQEWRVVVTKITARDSTALENAADEAAALIVESLDETAEEMLEASEDIEEANGNVKAASNALYDLLDDAPSIISLVYADADEICITAAPEFMEEVAGRDMTIYGIDEDFHKNLGRIGLTKYQTLEEGVFAALMSAAVYENGIYAGYISGALDESILIGVPAKEIRTKYGYGMWVVEPSGMQIYDTDSDEVGLNILTDDRYSAEDIKAAAKLIVSEPQGTAVYTILDAGAKEPVTKDVAWTTITYGGQEWRVGVTSIR